MTERRPVVFFHVMKCGGTSVRAALAIGAVAPATPAAEANAATTATATAAASAAAASAAAADATDAAAEVETDPRRLGPEIFELDGELAKRAAAGTNVDNWVFRDALLPYVLEAMHPAVVLGHFRYRDRYAELATSAHFVTVLRDPVDRIVSLYKYRRYKEGIDVPVSTTFEEFLLTPRWAKEGHLYVETFCGRDQLDPRSPEAIAAAAENLRRFAVVGFTERLDDFSARVTACIGQPVSVPMYNTSPAPDEPTTDEAGLELARSVCAPDTALYQQVLASLA